MPSPEKDAARIQRINPYGQFPLLLNPTYELSAECSVFTFIGKADAFDSVVETTFDWAKDHVRVEPLTLDPLGVGGYLAVFCHYTAAQAAGPATGQFSYDEFTVFFPVLVTDVTTGRSHPALHIPYIYLDNTLGIAAGQQIYGIPKKPAKITIPSRNAYIEGSPFRVDVLAAETLSSPWKQAELFHVEVGPHFKISDEKAPAPPDLAEKLATFLRLPIIQLKQVPAANPGADGSRILYRGVVELMAGISDFEDFLVLPPITRVNIAELATERMTEVLGHGGEAPSFAATFKMAFSFGPGKVLYEEHV